jgi:hypothetical protein
MPEPRQMRKWESQGATPEPAAQMWCAYNVTRERFLCGSLEAGDFNALNLEARLQSLAPGSGAGIWIAPFRGISPTSVRLPIDLIYLDQNCVALGVVEAFPLSSGPVSGAPAASVIALPVSTVASAGVCVGDRLLVCTPGDLKRSLRPMLAARATGEADRDSPTAPEPTAQNRGGRVLPFIDRSRAIPAAEPPPLELPAAVVPSATPEPQAPLRESGANKPARSWWQRLIAPDPPQPRRAQRECLRGLAAYFFTGGDPVAHAIRDISTTGLYVLTEERWYPGTIVRMTLTDRRSGAEHSIMVHVRVMRWGHDGVGVEFVLADEKSARGRSADIPPGGATGAQVEEFIRLLRATAN